MTTIELKDGGGDSSEPVAVQTSTTTNWTTQNGVIGKEKDSIWRRIYTILTWTPQNCRWDPDKPPQFSMGMNVLFAFAAGCTFIPSYHPTIPHPLLSHLFYT
jgi:hypothetical protein